MDTLISELSRLCPGGVRRDVSLARFSNWKIGGRAAVMVEPESIEELSALRAFINREGLSSVVIGESTNLLFSDNGLNAICIRIGSRMSALTVVGCNVTAEAGIWVPCLARRIMQAGLTGAEHTCGIPGTLGGLVCMNGGSQRKGIGRSVVSVMAITPDGEKVTFNREDCGFGYRQSIFQGNGAVIAAVDLRFARSLDRGAVRREMLAIMRERSCKLPRKLPNCGSVFKSNTELYSEIGPPGTVIQRLGLMGYRIGDAQVSTHHANIFINRGEAQATDMLRLIEKVGDSVLASTGCRMESEIQFVTPAGDIRPAYLSDA